MASRLQASKPKGRVRVAGLSPTAAVRYAKTAAVAANPHPAARRDDQSGKISVTPVAQAGMTPAAANQPAHAGREPPASTQHAGAVVKTLTAHNHTADHRALAASPRLGQSPG